MLSWSLIAMVQSTQGYLHVALSAASMVAAQVQRTAYLQRTACPTTL